MRACVHRQAALGRPRRQTCVVTTRNHHFARATNQPQPTSCDTITACRRAWDAETCPQSTSPPRCRRQAVMRARTCDPNHGPTSGLMKQTWGVWDEEMPSPVFCYLTWALSRGVAPYLEPGVRQVRCVVPRSACDPIDGALSGPRVARRLTRDAAPSLQISEKSWLARVVICRGNGFKFPGG